MSNGGLQIGVGGSGPTPAPQSLIDQINTIREDLYHLRNSYQNHVDWVGENLRNITELIGIPLTPTKDDKGVQ